MSNDTRTVGVIGAGTMGAGIAQVAALAGWTVELMDRDEAIVQDAIAGIRARLDRLVEKGRIDEAARDSASKRLLVATEPTCLSGCTLIIEAIVEDIGVKAAVLKGVLPELRSDCIIATNTSSLSVGAIGDAIGEPTRTVGMHFFNPAPLMKLVEVVAGEKTAPSIVDSTARIAEDWGKKVACAADVPGFIVNHVARPYYLEAFRIMEDGLAGPDAIDAAMRTLGGFRMGPLELTDLIGQDVNTATTRSVWEQLDHPPLLAPSALQERLVAEGHLGRKSGRGVYDHTSDAPTPAVELDLRDATLPPGLRVAVDAFVEHATDAVGDDLERYIFARILIAIIAQAALAHERGVAEQADINTAMRFGVNYPDGPFAWAERIGIDRCTALLEALNATVDDDRFRAPLAPSTA